MKKLLLIGIIVLIATRAGAGASPPVGRVYVTSNPPGARIFVEGDKDSRVIDTGKCTPALVSVPQGRVTFVLRRLGFSDTRHTVTVRRVMVKVGPLPLLTPTTVVEFVCDGHFGRQVLINRKVVLDVDGRIAVVPCCIRLKRGAYWVSLVSKNHKDMHRRLVVTEPLDGIQRFDKTSKLECGISRLYATTRKARVVGRWRKVDSGSIIILHPDGTVTKGKMRGVWSVRGEALTVSINGLRSASMRIVSDTELRGMWELVKEE